MAPLSPGIPTSFVPRQPQEAPRTRAKGNNLFLVVSFFIFGLAVIASIGTFAYDRYLSHRLEAKAEELAVAQRSVNQDQVEDFVRLRDRLVHGETLLQNHVAASQFFGVLEAQTLQSVRYNTLRLTIAEDHTAQVDIEGTARNFNALAAQSNALAAEKDIRRAIFSGIVVNDNGSVNFRLTADLDARLIIAAPVTEGATLPVAEPVPPASEPVPDAGEPVPAEGAAPAAPITPAPSPQTP